MLDAVQTLRDLIRIDTANPPGDEMRLLTVLRDILVSGGAQVALQPLAHGRRGNLVARLPGKQQGLAPLVLISHVDVVPANPAAWTHPPFAAVVEDGYIYGVFCAERHDPNQPNDLSAATASAAIARSRITPVVVSSVPPITSGINSFRSFNIVLTRSAPSSMVKCGL